MFTKPLEREFEGWITRAIEDYLDAVGVEHELLAISGHVESEWPADVAGRLGGKVLGLQFKRPQWGSPVRWRLDQPLDQWSKVKSRREIYYALPAFFDRGFRRVPLHHTYFWRPGLTMPKRNFVSLSFIQGSSLTRTWGELFFEIQACPAGLLLSPDLSFGQYLAQLVSDIRDSRQRTHVPYDEADAITYALWMDVEGAS